MQTFFNQDEHESFTKPGSSFVVGHAIFLRPDNTFLVCCYAPVLAFPDTPYTREVIEIIRAGQSPGVSPFAEKDSPRLSVSVRCDHHGNFNFTRLHAERYFFAANVHWMEEGERRSGTLLSSLTLKRGENFLILTNVNTTQKSGRFAMAERVA